MLVQRGGHCSFGDKALHVQVRVAWHDIPRSCRTLLDSELWE